MKKQNQTSSKNEIKKYLSRKERKAIARAEKDRITREKALEQVHYREVMSCQQMCPVYDVYDSIIIVRGTHGLSYCKVMEFKPLNFMYLSQEKQNSIISSFQGMLSSCSYDLQLLSFSRKADVESMIKRVEEFQKQETNDACYIMQENYKDLLMHKTMENGVTRRFFVVLKFKSDISNDGADFFKVIGDLNAMAAQCRTSLEATGNQFIPTCETDMGVNDILYQLISRKKSETISFEKHSNEIVSKYIEAYSKIGKSPLITTPELVSPDWMDFSHYNYAVIDDKFYTFAYIRSNGYNTSEPAGWMESLINSGEGIDVNIYFNRFTRDEVHQKIAFNVKERRAKANESYDTDADYYEIQGAINAGNYLMQGLANGEDFYYVNVMITITADDLTELERRFHEFDKKCRGQGIRVSRPNFRMQEAFISSLPICSLDKSIYNRSKRNVLTSGASSFYPFVSFEMQDQDGIYLGVSRLNNSIVTYDPYDRTKHKNSNGVIVGSSGSGKTFTSHLLALRFRQRQIQTFILAPVKGERDYGNGCRNVDGLFVSMGPGTTNHINIMDIHTPDLSQINTLDDDAAPGKFVSYLAQKDRTILTFIKLLIPNLTLEEQQVIDSCIYETYAKFGITDDNNSIYIPGTHQYKTFPILQDLYDVMITKPSLSRVCTIFQPVIAGSLKSFNDQTNVDLTNLYIVFDFDNCDDRTKVMSLFVVLDFCWSKIKEDSRKRKAIFIDEAWNFIGKSSNPMCAEYIKEIFKTIRAYNGAAFAMTQDVSDFFTLNNGEYGRAIINNADTKIIMQLNQNELNILRDSVSLTNDECEQIEKQKTGSGLIVTGGSKLFTDFMASNYETECIKRDVRVG